MGKWTDAARALKVQLDERKEKSDDLDIIVSEIAKLPPGQLKKVLTLPVLLVLEKHGISLEG